MATLKIILINLQSGIGMTKGYYQYLTEGWKYYFQHSQAHVDVAIDFFKKEQADVLLITEIDGGSARSNHINQPELIAHKVGGWSYIFFPTTKLGNRYNQGNAIISKYPILESIQHQLPGKGEKRYLCEIKISSSNTEVSLFVTHLSLDTYTRKKQLQAIQHIISEKKGPIILAGDLNAADMQEIQLVKNTIFAQIITEPSYPSWKPKKNLDYIFLSKHFNVKDFHTENHKIFSDHLPLICEVEI